MNPKRSALLVYLVAAPAAAQSLGEPPRIFVDESRVEAKAAAAAIPPPDRGSVVRTYHTRFLPAEVTASGWAGSVSSCTQGSTTAAFKQSVVDRINAYRYFAGLPGVGLFTDSKASDTQRAALMMSANNALNHSPPTSWKCYTAAGKNAAYYSNLALGAYGFDAIDLYMDDPGTGNGAAGHRRWLLFPPQANVATGDIPTGSAPSANALWVAGPHSATRPPTPSGVAWPPRGYVPWDALPALSNRWSFSYQNAYFVGTNVTVTGPSGTMPVTVEPLESGYGDETIVFKPAGMSYTRPDGDRTYRVTLSSAMPDFGLPSSPFQYEFTVIDAETLDPALAGDFDGNGRSDLIWRNESTGQTSIWLMNGTTASTMATLMTDLAWRPALLGDFNGDGRSDIVWRNDVTGQSSMWLMNGTQFAGGAALMSDGAWQVTHAGDFNGDGKADLIWRNEATGTTSMWLMSGVSFVGGATLLVNGAWKVTHVADLNGDGKSDLLWRNDTTGETAVWLMSGSTFAAGAILLANPSWRVSLTTDLNGDGKADLVWRNDSAGITSAWLMNGLTMLDGATLLTLKDWRVVQSGDFDGDGKSDLVWRNRATGQTSMWLMNGLAYAAGGSLLTHPDWQPARIGNFNGDYGANGRPRHDLLWRNSKGGQHAVWLMNGVAMSAGATVLNGASWWAGP